MSSLAQSLSPDVRGAAPTPMRRARRIRGSQTRAGSTVRIAILVAWALYFLAPVYWLFLAATKSAGTLNSAPAFAIANRSCSRTWAPRSHTTTAYFCAGH